MGRGWWRVVYLMLGLACPVAYGCDGQPASSRIPAEPWSVAGSVVSVNPDARTFTLLGSEAGVSPYALVYTAQARFQGDSISGFDQFVAAFRSGMTLHVIFRSALAIAPSYQPSLIEVTTSAPVPVTFHKKIGLVETTPAPSLVPWYLPDASVFVQPWTEFRQDGDYTSWVAVLAATGVRLCVAGSGYKVHMYAIHATRIGVWRVAGADDNCEGK